MKKCAWDTRPREPRVRSTKLPILWFKQAAVPWIRPASTRFCAWHGVPWSETPLPCGPVVNLNHLPVSIFGECAQECVTHPSMVLPLVPILACTALWLSAKLSVSQSTANYMHSLLFGLSGKADTQNTLSTCLLTQYDHPCLLWPAHIPILSCTGSLLGVLNRSSTTATQPTCWGFKCIQTKNKQNNQPVKGGPETSAQVASPYLW